MLKPPQLLFFRVGWREIYREPYVRGKSHGFNHNISLEPIHGLPTSQAEDCWQPWIEAQWPYDGLDQEAMNLERSAAVRPMIFRIFDIWSGKSPKFEWRAAELSYFKSPLTHDLQIYMGFCDGSFEVAGWSAPRGQRSPGVNPISLRIKGAWSSQTWFEGTVAGNSQVWWQKI